MDVWNQMQTKQEPPRCPLPPPGHRPTPFANQTDRVRDGDGEAQRSRASEGLLGLLSDPPLLGPILRADPGAGTSVESQ